MNNRKRIDMKLTMLGTGNALVTECYNTCFMMEDNGELFMVDGGGGNTILRQIKKAGYDWMDVHHIFVTHRHIDHFMGIIWMARLICQFMAKGTYEGDAYIYSHGEVLDLIRDIAGKLLQKKQAAFIDKRLHLVEVEDGDVADIIGHEVTFFDIHSTKARQFGFQMDLGDGRKLTCCGDEPLNESIEKYVRGSEWMLHEAFCLYSQADIFNPYEKHHSTVRDASELAEKHGVKNLILYHTEDTNIERRKELYSEEGRQYFTGNLLIPDDLETINL